jgi:hypothetical protein
LFKQPQEPEIGALPRITPTAMITTTDSKTTNVIKNSIMLLPFLVEPASIHYIAIERLILSFDSVTFYRS